MLLHNIFHPCLISGNELTCVSIVAIPLRQEAMPRKRNFLDIEAPLELCVTSGDDLWNTIIQYNIT